MISLIISSIHLGLAADVGLKGTADANLPRRAEDAQHSTRSSWRTSGRSSTPGTTCTPRALRAQTVTGVHELFDTERLDALGATRMLRELVEHYPPAEAPRS